VNDEISKKYHNY
jgi:hypothetical protein